MPEPLPAPNEPQPAAFLFPEEVIQELTDQERKHGKYTLARLPDNKRTSIVQLLIDRRSLREIETMLHVHQETIRLVADAHAGEIDAHWKHFGKKLRRINWALADRLEKEAHAYPIQSIPLAIKLLGEHSELLEGRATERIEEVRHVDIYAHWKRFLAGEEIGYQGEKIPVIQGELVSDEAPAQDRPEHSESGHRSDVSALPTQESSLAFTGFSYGLTEETATKSADTDSRGGGDAAGDGTGHAQNDNGSQNFSGNGI